MADDARKRLEQLIFGPKPGRRYTQDSPILPDVWLAYGDDPTKRQDLILNPFWGTPAGELAAIVRKRLEQAKSDEVVEDGLGNRIAHIHSNVAVRLTLKELVRVALPLTRWWHDSILVRLKELALNPSGSSTGQRRRTEVNKLKGGLSGPQPEVEMRNADLRWLAMLLSAFANPSAWEESEAKAEEAPDLEVVAEGAWSILKGALQSSDGTPKLWTVNRNRPVEFAVAEARKSVKADAASGLFQISCQEIKWAVVDSGVDACHAAFACPEDFAGRNGGTAGGKAGKRTRQASRHERTRVSLRYDFGIARRLLDLGALTRAIEEAEKGDQSGLQALTPKRRELVKKDFKAAQNQLEQGRELDWSLVAPLLKIDPDEKNTPTNDHGTHVAGILGAKWDEEHLDGICPDIELIDLKVFDDEGRGDEFAVIAALQFVRYLNAQHAFQQIHGVNLSLSIHHDVANFACGQTPVCEECERLVASGVVVVAAAGNEGFRRIPSIEGTFEGYNAISITDPGNAEGVITVGATHRNQPHTYGVSYFSSRGPTGDGRPKPDLVAPGEKIKAPTPRGAYDVKDGTSMAAPHVSGAAAMLMARHRELIGQPKRIKEILCSTATDLGRERHFQGAGMLDVLRALQSV